MIVRGRATAAAALLLGNVGAVALLAFREPDHAASRVALASVAAVPAALVTVAWGRTTGRAGAQVPSAAFLLCAAGMGLLAVVVADLLSALPTVCHAGCESWILHGFAAHLGVLAGVSLGLVRPAA